MECKRCGNKDEHYFYNGSKGYYCRKCVGFKRVLLEEDLKAQEFNDDIKGGDYYFKYPLTNVQKEASKKCLNYLNEGNVFLKAVCDVLNN